MSRLEPFDIEVPYESVEFITSGEYYDKFYVRISEVKNDFLYIGNQKPIF